MAVDITDAVRMFFTLPIRFYTYLDLNLGIKKNIKGCPRPSFAKTKIINAWIIAIFRKNMLEQK